MEKWQLAGIFSADPRPKLDLRQLGSPRKPLRHDPHAAADSAPTAWLKATCRKLAEVITLF